MARASPGGADAPAHGYYVLSSSELEYERLKALRETRVQRILQVRDQGRTLAKERREFLSGDIERLKQENLASEKENWLREKAQNVDQMQTMFERLYLNVGQGHKQARSASAKSKTQSKNMLGKRTTSTALAKEELDLSGHDTSTKKRPRTDTTK